MATTHKERIVFIINPVSGKGRDYHENFQQIVNQNFDKDRYKIKVKYTKARGHAEKLTRKEIAKGTNLIVAVGGDGTINEVARAIRGSNSILGIIPTGSGNGLARHLGIPVKVTKAIEILNDGIVKSIDYGLVNGKIPFFCTCGIGFDAHIGQKFANSITRGFITYIKLTLKEYLHYKPSKYTIRVNGLKIKKKAFMVTFANAAQFGNNAFVSPHAKITDGLLDVCILAPFPLLKAFNIGFRMFGKTMDKSKYMEVLRAKEAIVKTKTPSVIHYDGEPAAQLMKKIKIQIVSGDLKVMVPTWFNG